MMNYDHVCPFCESKDTVEASYSEDIRLGRRKVRVEGLLKLHCMSCESECVPGWMHDANLALIKAASEENRGAVTVGALRRFRDTWRLSQKDASALFGAGKSSFGKWESGQAKLSTPSALLIQLATKFPSIVPYLAKLSGTTLTEGSDGWAHCSDVMHMSLDVIAPRVPTQGKRSYQLSLVRSERDWGRTYAVNDAQMLEAA